ncbi:peptidylprolyl isomerase [Winogradskyella litorisediminis]|uniref:Peptidylprolyl isomerase n=1 Tax=Winogradskyella litorisediminis TaxID=1156618 RepID=A0ABW3N7S6_9FLAO
MDIRFYKVLCLLFFVNITFSQQYKTLLTIDDEAVSTSEFLKLYNKNLDLVKDDSQKDIDNYLQLFIDYKLKLKEAKRLGLDEDANYKREFENYKKQLTKNYISDNKVTDALVKEAYERLLYDIKASHIVILDNPEVEDTLVAYNALLGYRKILKSEGYDAAKSKHHIDKKVLVEDLGYFSAFRMVYDFETAAYNTKPGEVSMPFKTDFGYHVVKVDEKRPSRGTMEAAHIMIALKQKDSTINPKERINDIFNRLQNGEAFDALAKQFSDDKSSARNGGKLRAFKSGELSSAIFEDAAFGLKNPGDISEPVKTEYGWHIIQLIKKEPIQSFEDMKASLEARVKRDARSKLINSAMVKELSQRYAIVKNPKTRAYFLPILENAYLAGKFNLPADFKSNEAVITVNDSIFTNAEFLQQLKARQRQYMREKTKINKVVDKELDLFYENSILEYRKDNLANENEEFADILKEYRDGLLLFALMEKEIWNKASKDTIGLKNYYEANLSKYQWQDRVEATIVSSPSKEDAEQLQLLLQSNDSIQQVKEQLKSSGKVGYIFSTGIFEKTDSKLPSDLEFKSGVSKIYNHNGSYQVYVIKAILPAAPKTLKEARGSVVNDYQNEIESQWLSELRNRFKVKVNDKVLNAIKDKMN